MSRMKKAMLVELGECAAILGALNVWISLGMHKAMATGGPTQELMLKDIQERLRAIHAIEAAAGISEASQNE